MTITTTGWLRWFVAIGLVIVLGLALRRGGARGASGAAVREVVQRVSRARAAIAARAPDAPTMTNSPEVELSGVITARGTALAGAEVRIDGADWDSATVVTTDDDGRYRFALAPGDHVVEARADGYVAAARATRAPGALDLAMIPAATITGVVVDADTGAPIAGMAIATSEIGLTPRTALTPDEVTSDARGEFVVRGLEPGRYAVRARGMHRFGQAAALLGLGAKLGVVIRTRRAYEISGEVTIEPDGRRCDEAGVLLRDDVHRVYLETARFEDGHLFAEGVLPGRYTVQPWCAGYRSRASYPPIVVVDRDVEVAWSVERGAGISGLVRSTTPGGLAGVVVRAEGLGRDPAEPRIAPDASMAGLDDTGRYTIRGLRPGRYRMVVGGPHTIFTPPGPADVIVELAGSALVERDLELDDRTGTVAGRAIAGDGTPLARADIDVRSPDGVQRVYRAGIDDAGNFLVAPVEPGDYVVRVSDSKLPGTPITVRAHETATVVVTGEPTTGVITGRVVDLAGQPVGDAFVAAARESDDALLDLRSSSIGADHEVLVASDGTFVIPGLRDGNYTVRAARRDGGDVTLGHVAVGADLALTLRPSGGIAAVVHGAGAQLEVKLVEAGDLVHDEIFVHGDGRFEIAGLPAGHYLLTAITAGAQQLVEVTVAEHATTQLELTLEPTVTLTGRAIDRVTRQPIGGLSFSASRPPGLESPRPSDGREISGVDGRFEIPDAPRGTVELFGVRLDAIAQVAPVTVTRTITGDAAMIDVGDVEFTAIQ